MQILLGCVFMMMGKNVKHGVGNRKKRDLPRGAIFWCSNR